MRRFEEAVANLLLQIEQEPEFPAAYRMLAASCTIAEDTTSRKQATAYNYVTNIFMG